MRHGAILAVLVLFLQTSAAEENPVLARVIDSSSNRIPAHTVAPEYPRKARRDRIEGRVQVCFDVDRQGRPRRIAVRNSSHRAFEKPSIKAVRASSFRPLRKEEPLIGIKSCRTFVFLLEPASEEANDPGSS